MKPDSYFAGHFDGEGCVHFRPSGKGYRVCLSASGAYKPTLDLYQLKYGGTVTLASKGRKTVWQWRLYSRKECLIFVDAILPFSEEKFEQLRIAKEFMLSRNAERRNHKSIEFLEFGEKCALNILTLKSLEYTP